MLWLSTNIPRTVLWLSTVTEVVMIIEWFSRTYSGWRLVEDQLLLEVRSTVWLYKLPCPTLPTAHIGLNRV